jgi:predicted transglutaminase-like cysteine proteinase
MVNSSLIQPRSSSPGRMLIESGWPHEVLLVTVVRDKKEEGHAVLTVTADKGDYILDNQTEHILLWSKTGYRFVKSVPTATSR